jgi:hypothetical protein
MRRKTSAVELKRKNMRILITLLLLGLTSCATTNLASSETSYPLLTVANVEKTCEPVENWNIKILPMPAIVLRFNNCAGVNDLLVIVAPTTGFSQEVRKLSVQLASIHYTNYLKRDSSPQTSWKLTLVKSEIRNSSDNGQEIFYYTLSSQTSVETND